MSNEKNLKMKSIKNFTEERHMTGYFTNPNSTLYSLSSIFELIDTNFSNMENKLQGYLEELFTIRKITQTFPILQASINELKISEQELHSKIETSKIQETHSKIETKIEDLTVYKDLCEHGINFCETEFSQFKNDLESLKEEHKNEISELKSDMNNILRELRESEADNGVRDMVLMIVIVCHVIMGLMMLRTSF